MPGERAAPLREDPWSGFFEELDKTQVPWRGLGRFRFQAGRRHRIGDQVLGAEEVETFAAAAEAAPQEIRIEGDPRRWWAYEGNWYVTDEDLGPDEVERLVERWYREKLKGIREPHFEPARPGAARPHSGGYLSICSMFLNGAPYLAEWIEFHLLAGCERFFLYDNDSTDESLEVLAPYVADGTVVVHHWPVHPAGQLSAFPDCLERHGHQSRWIAFIDLDEFLFSPTGRPLAEVLREFEEHPGVVVYRPTFGSSGHQVRPPGLVIQNYLLRCNMTRRGRRGKTIADPRRLGRCPDAHFWTYTEGHAVDERRRPAPAAYLLSLSYALLRLNHYPVRSREEFAQKLATPFADAGTPRSPRTFESIEAHLNDVTDLAAASYGPEVERALRRRRVPSRSASSRRGPQARRK